MTEKPYFLAVVGPTASGKSALAEALALRLSGEIISCDSMQIYRGMDIGTAKPTPAERARVPYHLVDILSPFEDFSAADYAQAADAAIADVRKRARLHTARSSLPFLPQKSALAYSVRRDGALPGNAAARGATDAGG